MTAFQVIVAEVCVTFVAAMPVGVPQEVTVRSAPLSIPVAVGELLTTRMRYLEAPFVFVAMIALTVPEFAVLLNVPMFTGVVNEPVLLES